jgi:uncharacterized protein
MNPKTINKLRIIAEKRQTKKDPSHDFQHILRVLNMAIKIGKNVKADLDIIIPAALFHDTVVYQKNTKESRNETDESAEITGRILEDINEYPKEKIEKTKICIRQCSFTKGIAPDLLESKVLQDADLLESTGAISIMRTFSSGGQMNRPFYNEEVPFFEKGEINFPSGIGLFYRRLLIAEKRIHTKFAKKIAKRRTEFLKKFLKEFKKELTETDIL